MRYHNITKDDMLNGDGLRVVLWVSGCTHGCLGCHNQITWNPQDGLEFDEGAKQEVLKELQKDYVSGITFSGGDPLHVDNRAAVTVFAKELKRDYKAKTIWLYTGSVWDEVKELDIMQYIDVLVDGKFIEAQKNASLHWKGSANQRVIDVKNTRQLGDIVLHGEASGTVL